MNDIIKSRLAVLAVLTILGMGMAAVGTTIGVAEPLSPTGDPAELNVTDENMTFTTSGNSEAVVTNLSNVREITVEETSTGQVTVQTVEQQPLTENEREQARAIAMNNETVAQTLDTMNEYELTVEPVQKLNASSSNRVSYDAVANLNRSDSEFTIATNTSSDQGAESVTITRNPNYVEDRVVVWIRQRNTAGQFEVKYTVDIDLANQTVTDITNWDTVDKTHNHRNRS